MMSLTFGLFNQVSGLGPLGPLVLKVILLLHYVAREDGRMTSSIATVQE